MTALTPMKHGASFNLDVVKAQIEAARRARGQLGGWRIKLASDLSGIVCTFNSGRTCRTRAVRLENFAVATKKNRRSHTPMKTILRQIVMAAAFAFALALTATVSRAADPLPSWNDGAVKKSIVTFVEKVTKPGSPDFVPPEQRIATFDNDGTLWCEKPVPVQLYFALDRVKTLAPQHPDWKTTEPFASLLKGDLKTALAGGDKAILELFMATHGGA
jgi:hypothetical protein